MIEVFVPQIKFCFTMFIVIMHAPQLVRVAPQLPISEGQFCTSGFCWKISGMQSAVHAIITIAKYNVIC